MPSPHKKPPVGTVGSILVTRTVRTTSLLTDACCWLLHDNVSVFASHDKPCTLIPFTV